MQDHEHEQQLQGCTGSARDRADIDLFMIKVGPARTSIIYRERGSQSMVMLYIVRTSERSGRPPPKAH